MAPAPHTPFRADRSSLTDVLTGIFDCKWIPTIDAADCGPSSLRFTFVRGRTGRDASQVSDTDVYSVVRLNQSQGCTGHVICFPGYIPWLTVTQGTALFREAGPWVPRSLPRVPQIRSCEYLRHAYGSFCELMGYDSS